MSHVLLGVQTWLGCCALFLVRISRASPKTTPEYSYWSFVSRTTPACAHSSQCMQIRLLQLEAHAIQPYGDGFQVDALICTYHNLSLEKRANHSFDSFSSWLGKVPGFKTWESPRSFGQISFKCCQRSGAGLAPTVVCKHSKAASATAIFCLSSTRTFDGLSCKLLFAQTVRALSAPCYCSG
jgi:hypothetical protein